MKKLLLSFALLLFAVMAFSQITVNVNGFVLDTNGDGVENVTVYITVDSTNTNFVYFNDVLTDADGYFSDSFEVPQNMTQGAMYIGIVDCNNSYQGQMAYWSPAGSVTVTFLYCNVDCSVEIEETNTGNLVASGSGVAPFSYAWNTGAATSSIAVQQAGNYCVTLTDANGCSSSTCYYFEGNGNNDTLCNAYILMDSINTPGFLLTAVGNGVAPYTYVWSTGAQTASITINAFTLYCVTVTDASGCESTACIDLTGNSCSVSVYAGNASVLAEPYGTAPFAYLWNTGQITQNIVPMSSGNFCVTVTDANGCVSTDCAYYQFGGGNDTLCYVTMDLVQGGTWLLATPYGTAPFSFVWSTNETTQSIAMNENIVYCVTVADATGCTSTACYDNTLPGISGYVFLQDSVIVENLTGTANLYVLEGDGANLVGSTTFAATNAGAYFDFENLTPGNYLVQAVLDANTPAAADYLPTYHFSAEFWDEADVITLPGQNYLHSIMMIPVDDDADGPGVIGGNVFDEDGFWGGHDDFDERNNSPLEGVEILLHNSSDQPIGYAFTSGDGSFSFGNLPYGTYTVYVEIPGVERGEYTVTLSPDNETVNNIVFTVTGNSVTTATRELLLVDEMVALYPNPVKNMLNVEMNLSSGKIIGYQVVNLTGQVVMNQLFEGMSMNLSQLTAGVYILKVQTTDGIVARQFVKE